MWYVSNPSANARLRKGERTIIFRGKTEFFFQFEVISIILKLFLSLVVTVIKLFSFITTTTRNDMLVFHFCSPSVHLKFIHNSTSNTSLWSKCSVFLKSFSVNQDRRMLGITNSILSLLTDTHFVKLIEAPLRINYSCLRLLCQTLLFICVDLRLTDRLF